MIRALYDKVLSLAGHRHAERWLAGISFLESSVFPIPPDVLLAPMVLAEKKKAWRFAFIATLFSVLGAGLGYLIGAAFWDMIGQSIIDFYGYGEQFQAFQSSFIEYGAWLVFIFGITFFPFKVITIASGLVALDPIVFFVASIASRAPRFFLVAGLLWKFGAPIQEFVEKRLGLMVSIGILLLAGGFLLIKYF